MPCFLTSSHPLTAPSLTLEQSIQSAVPRSQRATHQGTQKLKRLGHHPILHIRGKLELVGHSVRILTLSEVPHLTFDRPAVDS